MPIIASDSGTSFTPAPEGTWMAVCCDVVDKGMVDSAFGRPSHKVSLVWQLEPDAGQTTEGQPLTSQRRFTLSLHEHSALRPFLESWRGKRFTPEELKAFDLEKLIGANAQLQILHEPNNQGIVYANVKAIMPLPKNTPKLAVAPSYVRVQDRELAPPEEDDQSEDTEF